MIRRAKATTPGGQQPTPTEAEKRYLKKVEAAGQEVTKAWDKLRLDISKYKELKGAPKGMREEIRLSLLQDYQDFIRWDTAHLAEAVAGLVSKTLELPTEAPPEPGPKEQKDQGPRPGLQTAVQYNQPPGGRPFGSRETQLSVPVIKKDWNLVPPETLRKPIPLPGFLDIGLVHEPAVTATISIQLKNPNDRTQVSVHNSAGAQLDPVDITVKAGREAFEGKLTLGVQGDPSALHRPIPGIREH